MAEEKKNDMPLEAFEKYIRFKDRTQDGSLSCITCKEVETTLEGEIYPLHVIIKGRNAQYEFKKVKNCAELTYFLHRCEILDDADVYVIASKKRLDIETLLHLLNKQYREFNDEMYPITMQLIFTHPVKTILTAVTLLVISLVMGIKYEWLDSGLPLEGFPRGNIVQDIIDVLLLLITKIFFNPYLFILTSIIVLMGIIMVLVDYIGEQYPKFIKHSSFYVHRVLRVIATIVVGLYALIIIYFMGNQFLFAEKNTVFEAVLGTVLYPKVATCNCEDVLISHRDGKYAYVQSIETNTTDLNCSISKNILKKMGLKSSAYKAVPYDDLDDFRDIGEYCRKEMQKENFDDNISKP